MPLSARRQDRKHNRPLTLHAIPSHPAGDAEMPIDRLG